MKKYLFLTSFLLCFSLLKAQAYTLPTKKLTDQYSDIYRKTNPNDNFFVRMSSAINNFFLVDNFSIYKAIEKLREKNGISVDSAANVIFDTLIYSFSRDHLWDDYPGQQEKFLPFFKMYNSNLCPCITEKIEQLKIREDTAISNCILKIVTDTNYINETKKLLGQATVNEVQAISPLSGIFIFQNCPVMYRYFSQSLRQESVYPLMTNLNDWLYQLDKTVTRMYSQKSKDLAKTFPAYKKNEADLKLSISMLKKEKLVNLHDRKENVDGSVIFTNTYYNYDGNTPKLVGQIIYRLKDAFFTAPVLSWKFISAPKIKDKEKYLKQIKEDAVEILPPPPMLEMLKGVKIDSLKNNN